MYRAEERAGPEDVGEQALMRGLDTAFPFVRLGLSRSKSGRRSRIGHVESSGVPLPWSRPHCCAIDLMSSVGCPYLTGGVRTTAPVPDTAVVTGRHPKTYTGADVGRHLGQDRTPAATRICDSSRVRSGVARRATLPRRGHGPKALRCRKRGALSVTASTQMIGCLSIKAN
jgi:hypothetical protein